MSAAEAAPEQIATLRIELLDTEPVIWRQVEIPTAITLKGLHDVVQAAMSWDDQHLWELKLGRQRYGRPIPGDDWGGEPTLRAEKVMLAEVLKPRKTVFDYLYDFGDSWEHRLTITDVRPGEPDAVYPRYVAGEHAAPPEDCGGVPGFSPRWKPWPIPTTRSTNTSPTGSTATIRPTSTNSPSSAPSAASPHGARRRSETPRKGGRPDPATWPRNSAYAVTAAAAET